MKYLKKVLFHLKMNLFINTLKKKEFNWIRCPEEFKHLNDELYKYDNNFTATFNLKEGGTRKIDIF